MTPGPATATYQTRLANDVQASSALDAYARLFGRAERSLFATIAAGGEPGAFKSIFMQRFGLTARQYNAIAAGVKGKIQSIKECCPDLIVEATERIKRLEKRIAKTEQRLVDLRDPAGALKAGRKLKAHAPEERGQLIAKAQVNLHQWRRSLAMREACLAAMKADQKVGTVRLCFGSKKLFRAQFDLVASGYLNARSANQPMAHEAALFRWRQDWQASRSSQFLVLGSKDETAGCQGCVATLETDGSLTLRLRLPCALQDAHGTHLTLRGVRFAYGHEIILAALATSCKIETKTRAGKPVMKLTGVAISYRFLRDEHGWRVFATTQRPGAPVRTSRHLGAIGIDINADHLAVAETDRFGNLVRAQRIACVTYGRSSDQTQAVIGDAAKLIVENAAACAKPIVIEQLDFTRRKQDLASADPRQARMLSSFAYRQTIAMMEAACHCAGLELIEVNPAYTSVIGAVNHARLRGISVHQGAALAIARRGLDLSESPTVRTTGCVPVRNGGHVTFALPARNRVKHVWSFWSAVRTTLKAAHAAHFRSGEHRAQPAPLSPGGNASPALGAHRTSPAGSRRANRSEHCSLSVSDTSLDVPL